MNILQYFHAKDELPMFEIGDKVRLKDTTMFEQVRLIYNKHYPSCFCDYEKWHTEVRNDLLRSIGSGNHIVSKIEKGTPAAGGWFVYIDNKNIGYHSNIFELIKL